MIMAHLFGHLFTKPMTLLKRLDHCIHFRVVQFLAFKGTFFTTLSACAASYAHQWAPSINQLCNHQAYIRTIVAKCRRFFIELHAANNLAMTMSKALGAFAGAIIAGIRAILMHIVGVRLSFLSMRVCRRCGLHPYYRSTK